MVVSKNGPYEVSGGLPLQKEIIVADSEGSSEKWKTGKKFVHKDTYSLCRCGHSKSKPYCDSTHTKIKFDGTETASRKKYLDLAQKIEGPELDLTDAESYCAFARFCDRARGVWQSTVDSDDPDSKKTAIQEASLCPSGRLVAWDKKTGKPIEPKFEKSIGVVEDPQQNVSGPLRLKGGITLESADGTVYETRNRMTLCRCGQSGNKPFCDGTHASLT